MKKTYSVNDKNLSQPRIKNNYEQLNLMKNQTIQVKSQITVSTNK